MGTYYEYPAIVNGEYVTLKTNVKTLGSDKLYSAVAYDTDDIAQLGADDGSEEFTADISEDSYAIMNKKITAEAEDGKMCIRDRSYCTPLRWITPPSGVNLTALLNRFCQMW